MSAKNVIKMTLTFKGKSDAVQAYLKKETTASQEDQDGILELTSPQTHQGYNYIENNPLWEWPEE